MNKQSDWVPAAVLVVFAFVLALLNFGIVVGLHALPLVQYVALGLLDAALVWLFSDNSSHSDV